METRLYDLEPGPDCPEIVRMIVQIPKNSSNKYEYDGTPGVFRLDRALYSPLHCPGDYGFIPGTLAEDRDPLDVLVLVDESSDPRYDQVHTIGQAFPHKPREIEHFFAIYKELEGKRTEMAGWRGPREAREAIRLSRARDLDSRIAEAIDTAARS